MIDILIPTFNRAEFLRKNILSVEAEIIHAGLQDTYRIIVSDNFSSDHTAAVLSELSEILNVRFLYYRQESNLGLEGNALFLLEQSTADYVMYLGDDDFLPQGYLEFVAIKTATEGVSCVIPGFCGLLPRNIIRPERHERFDVRKYPRGFSTVRKISNFGHQLSGLVTRREGVFLAYTDDQQYRNIYLFVFFVTYCMLRGDTYYAPKYQVLVSQGNSKDWEYDESGLLIEVFKNYKAAFPGDPFKAALACISFARIQSWRLRVGKRPLNAIRAFLHLITSRDVSLLVKVSLFVLYPYCYVTRAIWFLKQKMLAGFRN